MSVNNKRQYPDSEEHYKDVLKHISPQKVHYHMLRAKFLCKQFPELESKQCPDEPGEIQGLLHTPSFLCDLWKYKQITRVLKMTCTGCSSYIGFPLNTLWRWYWQKDLFPILYFLGLSFVLRITALATPFLLLPPRHCQSHWLSGCWKE